MGDIDIIEVDGRYEVKRGNSVIFVSTLIDEVENFIKWKLELDEIGGCTSCG